MSLLELPQELLLLIADNLPHERDILALTKTCQSLHDRLIRYLYRRNLTAGASALFWCAEHGFAAGVKRMLLLEADPDMKDKDGYTPLRLAAKCGLELMKRMRQASFGEAAWRGQVVTVHHGRSRGSFADTPQGYEQVAIALIVHGADPDQLHYDGGTPLTEAIRFANLGMARMLLSLTDVRYPGKSKLNPSLYRRPIIFSLLEMKELPLRKPLLQLLLRNGIDIDATDSCGRTALKLACEMGLDASWVQLLLEHGAQVDSRYNDQATPLHSCYANVDAARVLLAYGADVNAQDFEGRTPLHRHLTKKGIVQLLIYWGADTTIENNFGETPIQVAVEKGMWDVVNMLYDGTADD